MVEGCKYESTSAPGATSGKDGGFEARTARHPARGERARNTGTETLVDDVGGRSKTTASLEAHAVHANDHGHLAGQDVIHRPQITGDPVKSGRRVGDGDRTGSFVENDTAGPREESRQVTVKRGPRVERVGELCASLFLLFRDGS